MVLEHVAAKEPGFSPQDLVEINKRAESRVNMDLNSSGCKKQDSERMLMFMEISSSFLTSLPHQHER